MATGLEVDLKSEDKKCAMVLVVNVTNADKQKYDAYYEKCSTPGKTEGSFTPSKFCDQKIL
jgi:hypothetical protein